MKRAWALLALIVAFLIWGGAFLIEHGAGRRVCARAGYPRTVNVGYLWPDVRCLKLVNGTEVMR